MQPLLRQGFFCADNSVPLRVHGRDTSRPRTWDAQKKRTAHSPRQRRAERRIKISHLFLIICLAFVLLLLYNISMSIFFVPGSGSLAVARECVKSGLPVFAFQPVAPAPIPSTSGAWIVSSFAGFVCWQWQQ